MAWNMVGGFNHLEKYELVNGKDYPIMEDKKCLKPPTSIESNLEMELGGVYGGYVILRPMIWR
jgi:hypothetical protein